MIKLLAGDCRDVLPTLAADSVQCVVTSPPYYGLRDYGTALWDGGDAACDHRMPPNPQTAYATGRCSGEAWGPASKTLAFEGKQFRDTCGKCGAVRIDRQIGLESTPDEYLATMVAVFREIRRVMRPDAVAFINMGDGYRDKQLLLMPARLALALQADGWWVRSDIIWHKPNPMPESCTDRPTSAHEHVFLLTKAPRYYFDGDAIRQEPSGSLNPIRSFGHAPDRNDNGRGYELDGMKGAMCRNVWTIATAPYSAAHFATFPPELAERCIRAGTSERGCCAACGKPWGRITERAFTPQTDVSLERGIKGAVGQKPMDASNGWDGIPRGTTSATTTGWAPGCKCDTVLPCLDERQEPKGRDSPSGVDSRVGAAGGAAAPAQPIPCTVLDPFAGAGTTLLVADRLQRDAIGIELNTAYTEMAMERCRADAPLFTSFPPAEDPEDSRMADLFAEAAE